MIWSASLTIWSVAALVLSSTAVPELAVLAGIDLSGGEGSPKGRKRITCYRVTSRVFSRGSKVDPGL